MIGKVDGDERRQRRARRRTNPDKQGLRWQTQERQGSDVVLPAESVAAFVESLGRVSKISKSKKIVNRLRGVLNIIEK